MVTTGHIDIGGNVLCKLLFILFLLNFTRTIINEQIEVNNIEHLILVIHVLKAKRNYLLSKISRPDIHPPT